MTFSANDIAKACLVGENNADINQHMETISVDVADILRQIAEFDGPGMIPTTKPRSVQDVQLLAARCSFRLRSILLGDLEKRDTEYAAVCKENDSLSDENIRLEEEVGSLKRRLEAALKASGSP